MAKNSTSIIRSGDDLLKIDNRGRVIGKVPHADNELATKDDLKVYLKSDEIANRFATKAEVEASKPDLTAYLMRSEAERYILKKNLNAYPNRNEVKSMLEAQKLERYLKKADLEGYVHRSELPEYVSKEELARLVSPGLLAKLATKEEVKDCAKKHELARFALKDQVLSKDGSQTINGDLRVVGRITENGKTFKLDGSREEVKVRLVKEAPARLTDDDECVVIMNSSGQLFGVILPEGRKGMKFAIKDGVGNSYHCNIHITASGDQTIDGRSDYVLSENYGKLVLVFNGIEWNVF